MGALSKLKTMTDAEIQNWLRKVEKAGVKTLVYSLLGADDEARDCVFRNMSGHAVKLLKADLEKYKKMNITESMINLNAGKLEKLI